ncbi:serine/threonine-protein kinase [Streptosporangium sp. NPDC004631]
MLADRYELIAPLGRGTMGTVWRAHDRSLGREVAIKEIRQDPGLSEDQRAELRERMIREGRTAARISHPSVATVHDAIIEGGSPWIIMELVQARSLEQVIEEEGPLPPRLVAEIGVDLLGALRAAHAQGVLHRDVKPGNVLITETGRVVLTDFGIAKSEGDSSLTKTGMVIGSPGYTAPERARGEHNGPESDLWSLGATLYFAVEGRPAYERSSLAATLAALMREKADPPTQAGPLRPVLEQLLERDYRLRLSPTQAIAMLRTVADTPSAATEPPSVEPSSSEPPSATSGAGAAKPSAAEDVQAADEEFDADRTVLVIRPKGGLRLAGPGAPAAKTSAPVAGGDTVAFIPAATVGGPPVSARPGRVDARPGGQGGPEPGRPGNGQRSPSGPAGPGAPAAGRAGSPVAVPVGPSRPPGLGTDLFAIADQNGRGGRRGAPVAKTTVGLLVLMGVAAVSLLVIVILAVAAFAHG